MRGLLQPDGRFVFDVFAPSREDIEETNGRWLEREPEIYERADWDEQARTLTLSVRGVEHRSTMRLAWLDADEWRALLEDEGFAIDACYGWFDRRPYSGGEDTIWVARAVRHSRRTARPRLPAAAAAKLDRACRRRTPSSRSSRTACSRCSSRSTCARTSRRRRRGRSRCSEGELFAQPSLVVDERRYRRRRRQAPGTFRISRGTRGIRFDWLQPRGPHSVRLGYRLALFGTAYTDVVDLRVPSGRATGRCRCRELTAA